MWKISLNVENLQNGKNLLDAENLPNVEILLKCGFFLLNIKISTKSLKF